LTLPVTKDFQGSVTTTANAIITLTDQQTGLTSLTLTRGNTIRDAVIQFKPAGATFRGRFYIFKDGQQTPVTFYSTNMDVTNDGRLSPGPIALTPGLYQIKFQTDSVPTSAGTISLLVSFASPPV